MRDAPGRPNGGAGALASDAGNASGEAGSEAPTYGVPLLLLLLWLLLLLLLLWLLLLLLFEEERELLV